MSELNKESVEQAGGDERAAFEAAFAAMGRPVCRADYDQDAYGTPFDDGGWTGWQARAALAQPSGEVVVTKNESGAIVSVTRQDKEGRVLSVIAESQPSPAQAEQAEAERPEVVARVVHSNPVILGQCGPLNANDELMTVAQHAASVARWAEMFNRVEQERDAALAEVERIKTISDNYYVLCVERQQQLDAAMARVAELEAHCVRLGQGGAERYWENRWRDADARLQELEKQEPVATVAKVPGEDWNSLDFHRDLQDMQPGTKLYTAPVAQAQHSVPDDDMILQIFADNAEHSEQGDEHGYCIVREQHAQAIARKLLAAAPGNSAQHSVPEGWKLVPIEPLLNMMSDKDHDTRITAERQLLSILADAPAQAQHSAPEVSGIGRDTGHPRAVVLYLRKEPTDDDLRAIHDALRSLAAAPGKEVPQAWLDVQAERRRQITAEGWTPEHDDLYCAAELPRAAAAYILNGANDEAPAIWPFSAKWWKPRDARANYVRAAALILAEIERLDRAAPGKDVGHE
ncbi:hypothetical protein [Pseudomonas aeruginosa]|uniref:hypothetical protein n=1 Tax=Pseudomonas aeruginosa TaxID=287 RepID=UPI00159CD82D|nr:hypothetical protein [Pseudomonas aeruginosa]QKZ90990.1 hypothetical protein HWN48_22785 [Pseudomonas aeruginosa]